MSNQYIIMADVIGSRNIAQSDDFIKQFRQLTQEANKTFKKELLSPLTITLGDEFQGVLKSAESLFHLLFYLDEQIIEKGYSFQLRYSLVWGEIETKVNPKVAHDMYGSGLTHARQSLGKIKESGSHHHIEVDRKKDDQLNMSMRLYQSIRSEWKKSDYEVIAAFIKYDDYKSLIDIGLYKTRSGAWKKRKTLRIEEYVIVKELTLKILLS